MLRKLLGQKTKIPRDSYLYFTNQLIPLIRQLDEIFGEGSKERFLDALNIHTNATYRVLLNERTKYEILEGFGSLHTQFYQKALDPPMYSLEEMLALEREVKDAFGTKE